jgi:hypothetical protein
VDWIQWRTVVNAVEHCSTELVGTFCSQNLKRVYVNWDEMKKKFSLLVGHVFIFQISILNLSLFICNRRKQ